jgi:DNA-binding beta-propeller fold protein YncE
MCKKLLSVCIIALAAIFGLVEMGSAAVMTTQVNTDYVPGNTTYRDTGDVLFQFNAPSNYTDGMAWDGSNLWLSCDGLQRIWKLDTLGNVLDSIPSPGPIPTGLTWDGQYLWCANHIPSRIYKVDPTTGSIIDSIPAPGSGNSCEGLAWMNDTLWNANWSDDSIWALDPTTGNVWNQFAGQAGDPTGLTWDWHDNCLWNSDYGTDLIYKLDPATGTVITSFGTPCLTVQDLAFDGTCLWTCDYNLGVVYKMDIGYTGVEEQEVAEPFIVSLQVSPNPFKHKTDIRCQISNSRSNIELRIYDITGHEVRDFTDQSSVTWDGTDQASRRLPSGVYFVKLEVDGQTETQKLLLIR